MELENIHLVAIYGFVLALVFGAVSNKTNFCTMGAISDWLNIGSKGRMAAWVLAMGVAIAGTQLLELLGVVNLDESIYRTTSLGLGGHIIGGLLFGIGMTLAGGCGQRTLVRVGGGNLKSLVVFIVLGITAYMTLRGILGLLRLEITEPLTVDLAERGIADQGLATLIASAFGLSDGQGLKWLVAAVVSLLLIGWSLRQSDLQEDKNNLLAGIVIGLIIVAAWVATGVLGMDDFDPVPVEAMSFVAPTGNAISYLMTYTGATINFGIAVVFGVILGSFLYAIVSRTFLIETFAQRGDMINHLVGAVLMGFGGVLSLGCTIGQGVSGLSTLAVGSFITLIFIMIGSAITMRSHYHRLDDQPRFKAAMLGTADILLPWRSLD